jgi:hypothetical protein
VTPSGGKELLSDRIPQGEPAIGTPILAAMRKLCRTAAPYVPTSPFTSTRPSARTGRFSSKAPRAPIWTSTTAPIPCHLLQHGGGQRLLRGRASARAISRRPGHRQGLYHPRGGRPLPHRIVRRHRRSPFRPKAPNSAPPRDAARRCGWLDTVIAAQCRASQRPDRSRHYQAGRAGRHRHPARSAPPTLRDEVLNEHFPADLKTLADLRAGLRDLPGWPDPTSAASAAMDDLPENTPAATSSASKLAETPVDIVSVGPGREETIVIKNPFDRHG